MYGMCTNHALRCSPLSKFQHWPLPHFLTPTEQHSNPYLNTFQLGHEAGVASHVTQEQAPQLWNVGERTGYKEGALLKRLVELVLGSWGFVVHASEEI